MKSGALLVIFTLALTLSCAAEVPELFRKREFSAATLAETVNHWVALGEERAVREMLAACSREVVRPEIDSPGIYERVGWMCRVLFEEGKKGPLRAPMYGALSLPHASMPMKKWPLFPVAKSGETYFVLAEGYALAGLAERPQDYLEYCRKTGVFRKTPLPVPARAQALKDAAALRASKAWQAIRWKAQGPGFSYTFHEEQVWRFIQAQAERVR